jgi:hypothetical protein
MSLADPPTLDQVLILAARLRPADKLRLIERLAPQVADALAVPESPEDAEAGDQLDELDQVIAEAATLGPLPRDSADVISEMRR